MVSGPGLALAWNIATRKLPGCAGCPAKLSKVFVTVNVASDGSEVYVGQTMSDIGVYSADTLKRLARIAIPGGADQALATMRMIRR